MGLRWCGIGCAPTAHAPALPIVTEYKTDGPVTQTLIPLAVLDDVVAIAVLLSVMGIVMKKTSGGSVPMYIILLIVLFPLLMGSLVGFPIAQILKRCQSNRAGATMIITGALITALITMWANEALMPHSGVSLVLTRIAISSLTGDYSQYGDIVRGTLPSLQS